MEKQNEMPAWANFEDWTLVARSGNFLIKEYVDDELSYYCIKAVSGNWAEVFRNDSTMYQIIASFLDGEDENMGNVLDTLIGFHYTMANVAPDRVFAEEFAASVENLHKRIVEYAEANNPQSNEEILAEDMEAEHLEEQMREQIEEAESAE